MLTQEQIDAIKSRIPICGIDGMRKMPIEDLYALINMATTLSRVKQWANVSSGIRNKDTLGGYQYAQFDVNNIIEEGGK